MEANIHMIHPSIDTIHNIPQVNSKSLIPDQQRTVPRDVLFDGPDGARGSRLRRAAPENLDAAKPDAEDPVELPPLARCRPFQNYSGEFLGPAVRRRGVLRQDRGLAVGEAEIVAEEEVGAGFSVGQRDGSPDFEVSSGRGVGRGQRGRIGNRLGPMEGGGGVEGCGGGRRRGKQDEE